MQKNKSTNARRPRFEPLEPRQMLATTTLSPVADTFISYGVNENVVQGSNNHLYNRQNDGAPRDFISYVRFDLSWVTGPITDATFSLTKTFGDAVTGSRFRVLGLDNVAGNTSQNWSESSLTWSNVGSEANSTLVYPNPAAGESPFDLTRVTDFEAGTPGITETILGNPSDGDGASLSGSAFAAWLEARRLDGGMATLIVDMPAFGNSNDREFGFGSRENPTVAGPTLELNYNDTNPQPTRYTRQVEDLNRGVIAVRRNSSEAYLGWRMLGTDPADVAFNVYRNGVKLNADPLVKSTNYVDTTVNFLQANEYYVRPIVNGLELGPSESFTLEASPATQQHLDIPLQIPAGGITPAGESYTYTANDASIGDLDGDGQYEIILKWEPTNKSSNAADGYTGNTYIDAYNLEGHLLWRIDLGNNIHSGPHFTQFLVYDFDGDGKAEVVMKTAPGTIDGQGNAVILPGDDPNADYREPLGTGLEGQVLSGEEYLTVFDGLTGGELATIEFPLERGTIESWGDNFGNRSERYLAGVAYLDGERPSIVWSRGIYGPAAGYSARNELVALDWREGQLTQRWRFNAATNGANSDFVGEGAQSLSVADVDGDGYDEIVYGAAVVDHDGTKLYATGWGHGDALHVADMLPSNPGLEIFMPHESASSNGNLGATLRDAATGNLIFSLYGEGDIGRGVAGDIDPNHTGFEYWATTSDPGPYDPKVYDSQGQVLYDAPENTHYNFLVWWDADLSRETLDREVISEWNNPGRTNILEAWREGAQANNDSKETPALTADIFGDWREEVIWRSSDNTELQIWTTTSQTTSRLVTLMHDTKYRTDVAWQNAGYNQPPHPSFYLGAGMIEPPTPDVSIASAFPALAGDFDLDRDVDGTDLGIWNDGYGSSQQHGYLPGDADNSQSVAGSDFLAWQRNFGMTQAVNAAPTVATPAAAAPATVTTTTTDLSVLGADDGGEAALTYSWIATGPGLVTFAENATGAAKNTTATFSAAGEYSFTVTIRDALGQATSSQVDVTVNQVLSGVSVTPAEVAVLPSGTQQLMAMTVDQFGDAMPSQPASFNWSVITGGGSVDPTGLYTAPGAQGSAIVQAEDATSLFTGTASIDIVAILPAQAWYKLDELAGDFVIDSSGNSNHATALNSPAWVSGRFDNALSFDGSDDYVDLPLSLVNSSAGSVSLWFNTGANVSTASHLFYASSVTSGNGGGAENELHVNLLGNEQLQFFIEGGGSDVNIQTTEVDYDDNQWHHVVATWDINGNAALYVDGDLKGSVAHNASAFTSSEILRLGRPGVADRHYNGLLDNVRLYDFALNAANVTELFNESSSSVAALTSPVDDSSTEESLDAAFASLAAYRQVGGASLGEYSGRESLQELDNTESNFVSNAFLLGGTAALKSESESVVLDLLFRDHLKDKNSEPSQETLENALDSPLHEI